MPLFILGNLRTDPSLKPRNGHFDQPVLIAPDNVNRIRRRLPPPGRKTMKLLWGHRSSLKDFKQLCSSKRINTTVSIKKFGKHHPEPHAAGRAGK